MPLALGECRQHALACNIDTEQVELDLFWLSTLQRCFWQMRLVGRPRRSLLVALPLLVSVVRARQLATLSFRFSMLFCFFFIIKQKWGSIEWVFWFGFGLTRIFEVHSQITILISNFIFRFDLIGTQWVNDFFFWFSFFLLYVGVRKMRIWFRIFFLYEFCWTGETRKSSEWRREEIKLK